MKRKLVYGLKEYFKPTPKKVQRFLIAWKGIIASSAFVALSENNWKVAIGVGILGFIVNETALFFGENPDLLCDEKEDTKVDTKVEEKDDTDTKS